MHPLCWPISRRWPLLLFSLCTQEFRNKTRHQFPKHTKNWTGYVWLLPEHFFICYTNLVSMRRIETWKRHNHSDFLRIALRFLLSGLDSSSSTSSSSWSHLEFAWKQERKKIQWKIIKKSLNTFTAGGCSWFSNYSLTNQQKKNTPDFPEPQ